MAVPEVDEEYEMESSRDEAEGSESSLIRSISTSPMVGRTTDEWPSVLPSQSVDDDLLSDL